jgi:hypothetical protein
MAKTGVVPGTGKLTGRFCVRVPVAKSVISSGIKMGGCFKSEAAAKKKFAEMEQAAKSAQKKQEA